MRRLQHVEATAAVFGGEAVGIDGVGDEGAIRTAVIGLELGQRHDLVDDPGQLKAGFAAFDLRHEHLAIEVIQAFVEDRHEDHVLAPGMLQVGQGTDHFLPEQTVGRAQIRLAGTVADRTRLGLAPREALPRQLRDRVQEEGLVTIQLRGIAKLLDDVVVMRLRKRALGRQGLVWSSEEHEEVAALRPGRRTDGVARPIRHGQIARLDVEEQRRGGIEVFEACGFADAGFAQQQELDALLLREPLLGCHDRKCHHATSFNCSATAGFQRIW